MVLWGLVKSITFAGLFATVFVLLGSLPEADVILITNFKSN
jgi:hypothetical protein